MYPKVKFPGPGSGLPRISLPFLQQLLASLWKHLHCTMITVDHGKAARFPQGGLHRGELQIQSQEISRLVRHNSASLGVIFDREGEELFLFDENGRAIGSDLYTALWSMLAFRERGRGQLAVPVNVSQAVEEMAERYRGQVVRSKTTPRTLMELGQKEQQDQQRIFSPAALSFDGVAALIYLLDFLAAHDLTLSGLLNEIPSIRILERETLAPGPKRGGLCAVLFRNPPCIKPRW